MSPSTRVGGGCGATRVAGGHTGGMRHELDPDRSTVTVHASSSLHPITTDAPVTGWIDVAVDADGRLDAGALDFHGVTRPLEGVLRLTLLPDGEIGLKGSAELDVTDFDVQPPSLLVVKVHPQIRVELDAVAFPARNLS